MVSQYCDWDAEPVGCYGEVRWGLLMAASHNLVPHRLLCICTSAAVGDVPVGLSLAADVCRLAALLYPRPRAVLGLAMRFFLCRISGATAAAQAGGLAALVRTVGSFSINSPHTGVQSYTAGVPQIPVACITIEDAAMFARMQARGQTLGAPRPAATGTPLYCVTRAQ